MDPVLVSFFNSPAVLDIPGRMYPIELHYLKDPCSSFITTASKFFYSNYYCLVETINQIHKTMPPGDILVFLPTIKGT